MHISVQLEGESILTVEMLVKTISKGTVLFAEMLVEDNFKGEAFQLLNVCVKNNLKGEAFKLLKGWFKKKNQGGNTLIAEMLVEKQISREKHSNCLKVGKNNFKGEAF